MAFVALSGLGLTACGGNQFEAYCTTVQDKQTELSKELDAGGPDALLQALPLLEDLRQASPDDLRDEWQQVVTSIEGLAAALNAAGVDPTTYDRATPPPGVTPQQKADIAAAARQLGGPQTLEALDGIEQQARDVCQTPLTV